MKDYKSIGMVIGSFIGCLLAGVFSYYHIPVFLITLVIIGSTWIGYTIGSRFCKRKVRASA